MRLYDRAISPKGKVNKALLFALIGLAILLLIVLNRKPPTQSSSFAVDIQHDKYQAVTLTNNQVYFGKLDRLDNDGYTLSDVYYLRIQGDQSSAQQIQKQNQSFTLAKLGTELHGPQDKMFIERQQVLSWVNLKDDGQVVKAIKNDKK